MLNPRCEAVRLLSKFEKNSSYSAIAIANELKASDFSDRRDLSFTVALIYGVLEHKLTLDYNIALYLKSGINRLNTTVLNILRTACFQLMYLDRIPASAAVNEAVKLSRRLNASYASALINAVLRRVAENGLKLPADDNSPYYLSIKYSLAEDTVRYFISQLGYSAAEAAFESFSGRKSLYIRRNNLLCTEEELISAFNEDNAGISKTRLENCFEISSSGDITALRAYKKGYFHVQDMSSQLCVRLLDARAGEKIIDCCSAPGGKAFTCAEQMGNTGNIFACDIHKHKIKLIEDGAKRLGIKNILSVCLDAANLPERFFGADRVLCDVPCSGLGVIGRKPEIRYLPLTRISLLPQLQTKILNSCCRAVKSGGVLVYSTCTVSSAENQDVCDRFLDEHPDFHIAEDSFYRSLTDRYVTCLPDKNGGDGFFIAKFIRG